MTEASLSLECYSTILEEIKQFDQEEKRISLEGLSPKQRCDIYNTIETNYSDRIQYEKHSIFHGEHRQVVLILKKINHLNEEEEQVKRKSIAIDDSIIQHFCKYTKVPLPFTNHKFFDYMLNVLDPYTNCRAKFTRFLQDIEAHETVNRLNDHVNRVSSSIIRHLTEHPSVEVFKTNKFETEINFLQSSLYKSHHKFYTKDNQNKLFISIDVNKADYTIVKHYYPEVFKNLSTWEEFVESFCNEKPIQTLILSKHFRQRVFGEAKLTKKTITLAEYFVRKILHELKINPSDVFLLTGDETVLAYDPTIFRSMFEHYNNKFFKVLAFRLVKLPKYDYFIKEYFDPLQTNDSQEIVITRRELKCIPLPFIMQSIKQYEGKPILDVDRKFITETGHLATLDESIF